MAEYKNGFDYRGSMPVERQDTDIDIQSGRIFYVTNDNITKLTPRMVMKFINEGFMPVLKTSDPISAYLLFIPGVGFSKQSDSGAFSLNFGVAHSYAEGLDAFFSPFEAASLPGTGIIDPGTTTESDGIPTT